MRVQCQVAMCTVDKSQAGGFLGEEEEGVLLGEVTLEQGLECTEESVPSQSLWASGTESGTCKGPGHIAWAIWTGLHSLSNDM